MGKKNKFKEGIKTRKEWLVPMCILLLHLFGFLDLLFVSLCYVCFVFALFFFAFSEAKAITCNRKANKANWTKQNKFKIKANGQDNVFLLFTFRFPFSLFFFHTLCCFCMLLCSLDRWFGICVSFRFRFFSFFFSKFVDS